MKTRAIKLGFLTVLTVFISFTLWSNNNPVNENRKASMEYNSKDVPMTIGDNSNLKNEETLVDSWAGSGSGDSFFNSPDPFLNTTTIYYSIKENTIATLTVFSANQSPVVLVQTAKHQKGKYQVTFNAYGMEPGTYWAVLETGDGVQIELMTKKGEVSFIKGIPHKD